MRILKEIRRKVSGNMCICCVCTRVRGGGLSGTTASMQCFLEFQVLLVQPRW